MSEHNITFPSNGGTAAGYLELPASGSGPALIVIQEWWGLTSHIASLVKRFAAAGFVALAPDLYGGRVTHDPEEARRFKSELPLRQAVEDLGGAVDYLLAHEAVTSKTVGVTGFCMGGGFALTLAAVRGEQISAVAPFYGLPDPDTDWHQLTAAISGHYGLRDGGITPEKVNAAVASITAQSTVVPEVNFYDADHAFLNDERPDRYDPAAATQAWDRAVEFLRAHIR